MMLILAIFLIVVDVAVANPTKCLACRTNFANGCKNSRTAEVCASGWNSLGTTHCGTAAIRYRVDYSGVIETGRFHGCFDCTDKKLACFTLAGYLKKEDRKTLLECEIECCTEDNCNRGQEPTLTKDAIKVFTPDVSGPPQCQACLADDMDSCRKDSKPQKCGQDEDSLGTTHCGFATIKHEDHYGVHEAVYGGCFDCADKKAACATISGVLKSFGSYKWGTLLECNITCGDGDSCNNKAQCNSCPAKHAVVCDYIKRKQNCGSDLGALGTTHCGSAAIKYRTQWNAIETRVFQGCFDCIDKKKACFTLGGFLKDAKEYTLLQCEIDCCTGNNCNTQVPTLTENAITVFTPDVSGPAQCQECIGEDQDACKRKQQPQSCGQDSRSLGTTHCGSATVKYRDVFGDHASIVRGCINCADKKAACAMVGGFLKSRVGGTMLECDIDCCTGDNCNH